MRKNNTKDWILGEDVSLTNSPQLQNEDQLCVDSPFEDICTVQYVLQKTSPKYIILMISSFEHRDYKY